MTNNLQCLIVAIKKLKLTLAIKVLFVIWLSAFLVNLASSSSALYSTASIGIKSVFNFLKQQSENVMTESGVWLYIISFLWCILNYQKIKGYVQNKFESISVIKTNRELKKETTNKEWLGYACLFLAGMLLVDTFLYDSMTSFFRGSTQSQAMPKKALFFLMLLLFHKYRSVVLVMFFISVCVYIVLWLTERRKLSK